MFALILACGPKNVSELDTGPTAGWHVEEGWGGSCFLPPDFETIEDAELRQKMQRDTLAAMSLQWEGSRRDGIRFDPDLSDEVAAYLEPHLDRVQGVADQNHAHCVEVMDQGATTSAWGLWLEELHEDLSEEACPTPLSDNFHTLDIRTGWQADVEICAGTSYVVRGAVGEQFRLSAEGALITLAGDPDNLPPEGAFCREVAGCAWGMLVGRFEGEDGSVEVFPIGTEKTRTAAVAGTLSIAINDDDHHDNAWQIVDGVQDGVTLEIRPARD
ncbi:MAG TPA: hypothetical protein QGF58_18905 [Myxococcota bacterium]|nr:hypothetical protein [Myxococcota bacterium]